MEKLDESDYSLETSTPVLPPLQCLLKTADCKSKSCEKLVTCTDDHRRTHCYAISSLNRESNQTASNEIVLAGCWSGGDECKAPYEMLAKLKQISKLHEGDDQFKNSLKNFTLAESLRDEKLKEFCINYAPISANSYSYLTRNNQSICCCSKSNCNSNIIFTREHNPHELYAMDNFKPKSTVSTSTLNSKKPYLTPTINGQEIAVISLSIVIIFILLSLFLTFLFKRKLFFKSKTGRNFLPSILYTRAGSTMDEHENENNKNENTPHQALLSNEPTQVAVSFQPAPNIQILPDLNPTRPQLAIINPQTPLTLPPASFQPAFFSDNLNLICNSNNIIDKPYIPSDLSCVRYDARFNDEEEKHLLNDPNYVSAPHALRSRDLTLIEQIAIGQFSSVWKACLASTENRVEYAIKIFSHNQKAAWSNEKDIYNCLITLNENILKYFGSDQIQNSQSGQALPAFMCNEYWLITEYHSYGSLHDFLKTRLISWSQVISLCYSYFEGLAYLHSENCEPQKTFAIAHRDLKSKNVLVKKDAHTCCIADFGLALKLQNRIKLSSAEIRSKVGTRRYMSPELIEGAIAFTKETFLSRFLFYLKTFLKVLRYKCILVIPKIVFVLF